MCIIEPACKFVLELQQHDIGEQGAQQLTAQANTCHGFGTATHITAQFLTLQILAGSAYK